MEHEITGTESQGTESQGTESQGTESQGTESRSTIKIRQFEPEDAEQIAQLFHDTVREVNNRDYSIGQVKAWAPDDLHFRNWVEVCSSRSTYVADNGGRIVGFAELEPNGHIDCFYCHKAYQRCGIGSQLYGTIEARAIELAMSHLYVEASITARAFFQRMGFSEGTEQQVVRRGETFINYKMEKFLQLLPSHLKTKLINV